MFAWLSPYKWLLEIGAVVALFALLWWGIHKAAEHQREIGYQKAVAEYTAKELVAKEEARKQELAWGEQIKKAQDEADTREVKINELSRSVNVGNQRMRNTIANLRKQLSAASEAAARRQADAALEVSGECSDEYSKLAEEAARLASKLIEVDAKWPN